MNALSAALSLLAAFAGLFAGGGLFTSVFAPVLNGGY